MKFVILGFKKLKNLLEISSFYTCVPKITIIWCMISDIWSGTNKFFWHFIQFFALLPPYGPRKSKFWTNEKTPQDIIILQMCTINDSHMMYDSWGMECCRCHPTNNLKNQNFEKMKRMPGDIIILHMCVINDNHMMYGS